MTTDDNIPNRLEVTVGDTVSLTINDWVNEAKIHSRLIVIVITEGAPTQKSKKRASISANIQNSNCINLGMGKYT